MPGSSKTYHKLRVPEHVADMVRGLHPELMRKVKSALKQILENPSSGKALKEELKGLNSHQVGKLRVIYRPAARRVIEIVAIGPRKSIYRETYRMVKKKARIE
jgi:mRNA-degrading endonuclease RelE of RelBE toxin-antitoxin system